jgi:hypothetical protein
MNVEIGTRISEKKTILYENNIYTENPTEIK